jgi:NADPH:quinone reductase-like Zn-dependent oxidoreductase
VVAGEWVLIHAVGSGVGTAAVQLTRSRGARSIGTSRTSSKLKRALELGMDAGIDAAPEPLGDEVRRITGGSGANAALDLIGGSSFNATLDALALRGRVILIGLTAGPRAEVDLGLILRRRLRVVGTVLRSRTSEEKAALTEVFREGVLPLFAAGELQPVIDRVLPLLEVGPAHEHLEANANFGKVVVEID